MLISDVLDSFNKNAPVCVMTQSLLENLFSEKAVDRIFEQAAEKQYTKDLAFSTVVALLSDVVLGIQPSVNAAYLDDVDKISVSITSVYNKLNGVETSVSEKLVGQTAAKCSKIVRNLKSERPPLLKGYRARILDGNHLAGTEHRIEELRYVGGAPLPGKTLVVFDWSLDLMTEVLCCEDGHAQERSMFPRVLNLVDSDDLWIADRNFCTTSFLSGIIHSGACFVIRQHATNAPCKLVGKRKRIGKTSTGTVYEQKVHLLKGEEFIELRRVTIELNEPTRDGDTEMHLLTNLPVKAANATRIANLYRDRWTIETAFAHLTRNLRCEIKTLGYPKAALLGFCLAVVAYNVLSVSMSALRSVHGRIKVEKVSGYYLANEVRRVYEGMMIAIEDEEWIRFRGKSSKQMASFLKRVAKNANLNKYAKSTRGAKKEMPERSSPKYEPHVSTLHLIQQRNEAKS